jgi:hypothetical protein
MKNFIENRSANQGDGIENKCKAIFAAAQNLECRFISSCLLPAPQTGTGHKAPAQFPILHILA